LKQAALGVAPHGAEGQEHGQHGAEEERREHGQADERGPGEHALVELVRPPGRLDLVEGHLAAQAEEREEADGEEEDHEDDPPAHGLAQGIAGDCERAAHPSATASR
jgi:hypothetical protein